jgi:hypothetical protein
MGLFDFMKKKDKAGDKSAGTGEPDLKLSISPQDFTAGVESEMTVAIRNQGTAPAPNVDVVVTPLDKVDSWSGGKVVLGDIKPGETKDTRFRVLFSEVGAKRFTNTFSYMWAGAARSTGTEEVVEILDKVPSLQYLPPLGKFSSTAESEMTIRVRNQGSITAEKLSITVEGPVEFFDGTGGNADMGNLARRQTAERKFKVKFKSSGNVKLRIGAGYQYTGAFCGHTGDVIVQVE